MHHVVKRSYTPEHDTRSYLGNSTTHFRTIDFVNMTPHQIVVLDRQNVPVILPPAPAGTLMNPARVEIRFHYQFFNTAAIREMGNAVNYINTQLSSLGEERKFLTDTLLSEQSDAFKGHLAFTSVRKIPLCDIQNAGALYDQASDFVLTWNNSHLTTMHPESMDRRMHGDHEEYVKSRPVGFLIEIVDNESTIRERFTYACNSVIRIPAIKDPTRSSGIYASTIKDVGQSVSMTDTTVYTLTEAESKFGLYATTEEARTNGNPEMIAKHMIEKTRVELMESKNRASLLEAENRQIEAGYKTKMIILEAEQKEKFLQFENENKVKTAEILRLKEEVEKRKLVRDEYYEARSSERKDSSELVKFIPAVLMGFIGAAIIFRK